MDTAKPSTQITSFWSRLPDGHLFLGKLGPLAERGIRELIAIRLPNHVLILLPMDLIACRCRFQPFSP